MSIRPPRRLLHNRQDKPVAVAAPSVAVPPEPGPTEGYWNAASPEPPVNANRASLREVRTSESDSGEIQWLDLDAVAEVTIVAGGQRVARVRDVWSADCSGEQTIEVRFPEPIALSRLRLVSSELEQSRTQEMTVWASLHGGEQHREVLRQQFTFSPNGATKEVEEYALQLGAVSAIQLRIVPSIDGRPAVARVNELRLASASSAK